MKDVFVDLLNSLGFILLPLINLLGTMLGKSLQSLVLALPIMWLWNAIIPNLFGLPLVTFLQSWELCLLSSFLFGFDPSSSSSNSS